jgi:hypothetical protein
LGLVVGSIAYAWNGPSAQAPNGNVPAPINIGSVSQTKQGGLGLGTDILPGEMLRVLGDATFTNKAYSSPTVDGDAPSSLVTKSYVDGKMMSIQQWPTGSLSGGCVYLNTQGVIDRWGTAQTCGNGTVECDSGNTGHVMARSAGPSDYGYSMVCIKN